MRKQLEFSTYKNNVPAKKSRVFYSNLINYFSTFIVTFIFAVLAVNPIITNLPITKSAQNEALTISEGLYQIVDDFRVQKYDKETKSLKSVSEMADLYLNKLCLTSLYTYNQTYSDTPIDIKDTFFNIENLNYPNDNLSYYFFNKKKNTEDLKSYVYDNVDYSNNINGLMYSKVMNYDVDTYKDYFISETDYNKLDPSLQIIDRHNILSITHTELLKNYLKFKNTGGKEETTYFYLEETYVRASIFITYEIETKYQPYIYLNSELSRLGNYISGEYIIGYSLAYLLAFIFLYLIVPLFGHNKELFNSLGFRIIKLALTTKDEYEPGFLEYFLNFLIRFVIGYSCLILAFFFTGLIQITGFTIGWFSMIGLLIATLIFGLISNIFLIFSSANQDFTSFVSRLYIKDKTTFEGPIEDSGSKDEESNE
ncbi:MAG: hypothetical protein MJ227_04090 [Bacilli bacterium]|nr:hypothetical protein [Bacilli bacterium]